MWPFRKTPPVLILAPVTSPDIRPFYGKADGFMRFFKSCPANKGTNAKRLKDLKYELGRRMGYLEVHKAAVAKLERDCAFMQKAIALTAIK